MANIMDLFSSAEIKDVKFDIGNIKATCERIRNVQDTVGGRPTFKAKVGSGGVKVFTLSNGSRDIVMEKFQGIIIAHHRSNALFKSASAENESMNTPPVCSSTDGITGIIAETGECRDCKSCPYNLFGTAEKGGGKACKNMHRLYILIEGCPIPVALSIPPTSLEMWRNYALMDIAAMGFDMNEIVTEFTLTNEVNEAGQKYSIVNFKIVGKVNTEVRDFCAGIGKSIEQAPRPAIEADEYNREPTGIIQQDDEDSAENDIKNDTQSDIENDTGNEPESKAEIINNEDTETEPDLGAGIDAIIESEDMPEEIDFDSL